MPGVVTPDLGHCDLRPPVASRVSAEVKRAADVGRGSCWTSWSARSPRCSSRRSACSSWPRTCSDGRADGRRRVPVPHLGPPTSGVISVRHRAHLAGGLAGVRTRRDEAVLPSVDEVRRRSIVRAVPRVE
ncbi:hypothetical protein HBB16_16375 [Pseudonocardia sp. MCCB 268]|nr:hypothetical protein [Pseudonocardia cytotoxica]